MHFLDLVIFANNFQTAQKKTEQNQNLNFDKTARPFLFFSNIIKFFETGRMKFFLGKFNNIHI